MSPACRSGAEASVVRSSPATPSVRAGPRLASAPFSNSTVADVAAGSTPGDTRRLGDSAAGGTAVHAKTAPAAAGDPGSVRALVRHQRRPTPGLAPRPLPEPLLAYSRRGRIAHRQFRDFVVPARPLHGRWRRGRGPIARRPAGRTKRGSSGRGDRSSQAPGPGRAVQQERRGARSGREPVDRSSLDRAYRTYLPARPAHPRHLRRPPPRPAHPRPGCLPTYGPTTHRLDCLPPLPAHLRARPTY